VHFRKNSFNGNARISAVVSLGGLGLNLAGLEKCTGPKLLGLLRRTEHPQISELILKRNCFGSSGYFSCVTVHRHTHRRASLNSEK